MTKADLLALAALEDRMAARLLAELPTKTLLIQGSQFETARICRNRAACLRALAEEIDDG